MREKKDIEKIEIKKVNRDIWRFTFLKSGWVVIELLGSDKKGKDDWKMHLNAIDLGSALQYIWAFNNGAVGALKYEELESID